LHHAFEQRLAADYAPLHTVTNEKAQQVFNEAEAFVAQIKTHLAQKLQS
jgi:uncharacterized protein (UPF0332 family)